MSQLIHTIHFTSSQPNLHRMLGSMLKVYSDWAASPLQARWVVTTEPKSANVYVVDLDDEQYFDQMPTQRSSDSIVIALSKSTALLKKYPYHLSQPIRNAALLDILTRIEANDLKPTQPLPQVIQPSMTDLKTTQKPKQPSNNTPTHEIHYQLTHWPDLSQISSELLPNTSRVCALLATKPYHLNAIADFLNIPQAELQQVISSIKQLAFANTNTLELIHVALPQQPVAITEHPSANSYFLSKLWGKFKRAS